MSLIGIRDMSVLEEGPNDRQPIQTFVCEYNEELVREAIARELAREGQVYYVYNRVAHIADIAASVQSLVPEAKPLPKSVNSRIASSLFSATSRSILSLLYIRKA